MRTTTSTPRKLSSCWLFVPVSLALTLLLLFAFTKRAEAQSASAPAPPLTFGNNFFVTGDYIVGGAQGMNSHMSNGFATGTITIPDANPGITGAKSVPPGAQIIAALLYWQTVEKSSVVPGQAGSGANGFFRPVYKNGPATGYAITGLNATSHDTVSFSSGGCSGTSTGKVLRTYRADVRAYLPQDPTGDTTANGTYEVRLPSVGNSTPLTLGATLVIIYRVLSPSVPLNSIVIYDGAFAPTSASPVMTQSVQGFYDAAKSPISRLTHIVSSGQSNKLQTVFLDNVALPSLYKNGQPPFPGFYGSWDNPTWTFGDPNTPAIANPVREDDSIATTSVVPSSSNQGCVSWGAVIVSSTVKNTDQDGLLDAWKSKGGYCDASINEGVCRVGDTTDPAWVDLSGAGAPGSGQDVFVQLDYMCSSVTGTSVNSLGSCNTGNGNYSFDPRLTVDPNDGKDAVQKVVNSFASNRTHAPVRLHVNYTHAVQEEPCTDALSPLELCPYANQPGVVGWPGGVVFYENQLIDPTGNLCLTSPPAANCVPVFQHGKKDSYHLALFAHALGLPSWTLQSGTLTSVVQSGNKVTFTTSTPHGFGPNQNDPSCASGRVSVAYAITDLNLDGTFCVSVVSPNSFSIQVADSATATYTRLTDPNLAVASGQAGTVSGFSDIGGAQSVIALGNWGTDGQTWQVKAGTFMHEIGHSIGLTHGGLYLDNLANTPGNYTATVEANCKPNFQSVMNYLFQLDLLDNGTRSNVPDYSAQNLNTLNESLAGLAPFTNGANYLSTNWYAPRVSGTPASQHCDGTPLLATDKSMSFVSGPIGSFSWVAGQDINFDGNGNETMRGHNDWVGSAAMPGTDLRQISATGTISASGLAGRLGGGGGLAGRLGGGGGVSDILDAGGLAGRLGGGGGLAGKLGGGGGLGGRLGGGGGIGELNRATANSVTRPPRNLIAAEEASARFIDLSWTVPTFGTIGAYRVYRSADGGVTFPLLATVPGTQLTFQDTVACNPIGYQYRVTAVLAGTFANFPPAANEGQESVPSNTVSSSGQSHDPLTGCYALTGFSSPAAGTVVIQGSLVPISWQVQDDFYTTGAIVGNKNANTLVAIGPFPHDGACPQSLPNLNNVIPLSSAGSGLMFASNQFTFSLDTTPLNAGCYFFKLTLDSGQSEVSSPLEVRIFVSDNTPHMVTTALPNGTVGTAYPNTTIQEAGGVAPFTWTVVPGSGSLPAGITLNAASGLLSGTPCASGSFTFTAKVTDSVGNFGMQPLTLSVAAAPVPQVNQPLVPGSSLPAAASGFTLTVNGTGFVTCSAVLWNGSARATTFKSPTQLTATILAADVANFATPSVGVATTGSPSSNLDFFQITNPTTAVSLGRTDLASATGPFAVITADFNADGKPDLAVANSGSNSVSIWLGNGDGTFTAAPALTTGNGPFSLIAGDFNNDGKLDLAVANFASGAAGTVSIFTGKGDGTFNPAVSYPAGMGPISLAAGDFNADGKLDLAVSNQNDHTVSILLGNGDGTFQTHVDYPAVLAGAGSLDVAGVVTGDFNRDGKLDLAVTNPSSDQASILLGNGDGTFQNPVSYSSGAPGSHPIAVSAADFNGDGILDLAVTNRNANTVAIFLGNGDGTFQPAAGYSTTAGAMNGPGAVSVGDFNGDSLLDLAITNQNGNSVSILLGNANGTFQNPLEFATGNFAAGVASGDFNGDGRLDVAVANLNSNTVSIMVQPQVLLVPSVLPFGTLASGATLTSPIVLTNNGPAALTISNIASGGANPGDFTETDNCPRSPNTLVAGLNCTINVTFKPTAAGSRNATLSISDSASDSPQGVNLTGFATPPAAPTGLAGNVVSGSVALAWNAGGASVVGYNVYRAAFSGGPYSNLGTVVAPNFTDSTVSSGQTYFYVVTALDANGVESGFSNEVSVVVP